MNNLTQNIQNSVNNLESQRFKRPLKIPKSISKAITTHKYGRSIALFLELKPLFVSGVIFSEAGHIPYRKLSKFVNYSESGFRGHMTHLRSLGLITIDKQRNIHLCSYKTLKQLITNTNVKTIKFWKLDNKFTTYDLLHSIAIHENLIQQKYWFKIQLCKKLALEHLANLQITRYRKKNTDEQVKEIGFYSAFNDFILTNETNRYIETVYHRYSNKVNKYFDKFAENEKEIYKNNYLGKDYFNSPNPFTMLSGEKLSKMFGKKDNSTGYYLLKRLEKIGYVEVERSTIKTNSYEAEFTASFLHPDRPNFVNSKKYEKIKKKTRVKNYDRLYKTVVKFPNILNVVVFS